MAPEGIKDPQQSPHVFANSQVSDQLALDHFMGVTAPSNALQGGQNGVSLQVNDAQIFADLTVLSNVSSNTLGEARLNIMRSIETSESSLNLLAAVHQGTPTSATTTTSHAAAVTGATIDLDIAEMTVSKKGGGDTFERSAGENAAVQEASVAISDDTSPHFQIKIGRSVASAGDAGRLATDTTFSQSPGDHAASTDGATHGTPAATHLAGTSSASEGPVAVMVATSLSTATLSINPGISLGQLSSCVATAAIDTVGIGHNSASVTLVTAAAASVADTTAAPTTASNEPAATGVMQTAAAPQMVLTSVAGLATGHLQDAFIDDEGFGAHHGDGGRSWMDAGERIDLGNHAHDASHDNALHAAVMHMAAPAVDITHAQFADDGGPHGAADPHHMVFDHIEKYNH